MEQATTPIDRAILACGDNQSELARRIGTSPQLVSYWKKRGVVPAERAPAIEAATGIPRHELRPDMFGPAPASEAAA